MKTIFLLTDAGMIIVQDIAAQFHMARAEGTTNAALKTMHHFSDLPACITLYTIGMADERDLARMVELNYAYWYVIDDETD